MSSFAIASIVFGCSFGAALIGMILHVKLPVHHLDGDSRDVVKLVMGLIATMAALVLSLLIASANTSYDRQSSELKTLSTNILLLDRTLKFYGTDAKEARDGLRDAIVQTHNRICLGRVCGLRTSTLGQHKNLDDAEPGRAGVRGHFAITSADV